MDKNDIEKAATNGTGKSEKALLLEFEALKKMIFDLMPQRCVLKRWNYLGSKMAFMLSTRILRIKIIPRKSICAVCPAVECQYYNFKFKIWYAFYLITIVKILSFFKIKK